MTFKWTSPTFSENPTTKTLSDVAVTAFFETELAKDSKVTSADLETLVKENVKKEIELLKTAQAGLVQLTGKLTFWLPLKTQLTDAQLADTADATHAALVTDIKGAFETELAKERVKLFNHLQLSIEGQSFQQNGETSILGRFDFFKRIRKP